MRHYPSVKAILWYPLFFALYAFADDAVDRTAIVRVIETLNELPNQRLQHRELFSPGGEACSQFERLRKANRLTVRVVGSLVGPAYVPLTDLPTLTISHEPWGEATINLPVPRTIVPSMLFITPDVALVEAICTYQHAATPTPLVFLMKKERAHWKIVSFWVLASR
jgi:hypothetical protein